jgi:ubiquinone/menaquinone biosynthesis C-methylase UbiE
MSSHPLFARMFTRYFRPAIDRYGTEHRRRLLAGLSGRVVEVGAGDGGNLAHYPAGVTKLVALEPEPYLRAGCERQAAAASVPVEVVDGRAESLPLEDGAADAVVTCLVLCSVGDQRAALSEAYRVLRPGGELRFFEHVAAPPGTRLARVQRFADATVWPRLMGGCHSSRDTVAAIEATGFTIQQVDRFDFPPGQLSPATPHALGRALR